MEKRILNYTFQQKIQKDYNFRAEKHHTEENRELHTIYIPSTKTTTFSAAPKSATSFIIPKLGNILDQGNLGSCVANAFAFSIRTKTKNSIIISRLCLYDICRILDFTPLNDDAGTTVRTASTSIAKYGVVSETTFPYNVNLFKNLPPLSVFQNSKYLKKFTYTFISQDLVSLQGCLNSYKTPIVFGFLVYSSFITDQVANNGIVPMPNLSTETLEGGHCMNIIGYNDNTKMFTCANSWGTAWGNKGLCYIPYNYILSTTLASDFCLIQFIY